MTPPAGTAWIDPSNRIWIDNTTLKQFSTCSLAAMIRYGWGYQPIGEVSAPLKSGSAGHEAMAVYLKTWDKKAALDTLQEEYLDWSTENVPDGDRLSFANVWSILDAWFDAHPQSSLPFYVRDDLIEIPFAVAIADHVVFFGRMDFIGQSADDNQWYIVDNKFTGRMDAPFFAKFRSDTQMSGYIDAARRVTDRNVVGAFINAVELSKLPDPEGTRKCVTHKVPTAECFQQHMKSRIAMTTRTPDQLEEWRKTAVMKARQMRDLMLKYPTIESAHKLRQHGMFTDECVRCPVADWCLSGRQQRLVPTMLKHEPWHPWKYWESEVR